jgi:hypothetical protein
MNDFKTNNAKYALNKEGLIISKKINGNHNENLIHFEEIGNKPEIKKERKIIWFILSIFFLLIAIYVVIMRMIGNRKIADTAEIFWLTASCIFYLIYSLRTRIYTIISTNYNENHIYILSRKVKERKLKKFLQLLFEFKNQYLTNQYKYFEGLTIEEVMFCSKAKISPENGLRLKSLTNNELKPLIFSNENTDIIKIQGIKSLTTEEISRNIIKDNQEEFLNYGMFLFINNFHSDLYSIGLINTINPYEILKYSETNGINHNIENIDIINKCKIWDNKFGIKFLGIGFDFCEFEIIDKDINYKILAKEIYEFCPDVVDQGTETIEELEKQIKSEGKVFLWWD